MSELLVQSPYEPNYPNALGPHVVMNERMRASLLEAQQSIYSSIRTFPDNITTTRRENIANILGIKRWDITDALSIAIKWRVLDETVISRSAILVTNNSLLNLAALAYYQSGILSPDNQPQSYLTELSIGELEDHVRRIVRETRKLLGTSLLARGILDPQQRFAKLSGKR